MNGIEIVSTLTHWALIQDVTLTTDHLFLWIHRLAGVMIPLRDLPAGSDPAKFTDELLTLAQHASSPAH